MQADILSNTVKGALLALVIILLPLTCMGYVEGDINSDGKIGLQETIYSLQVAAGLTIPLSGTTINVPGDIHTIQQAIDAASDGDTINIAPGTFVEALTISGKALVLTGAGSESTFIDGGNEHAIKIDNSPGVLIENLTVQNGNDGIYVTNNANVRINQVTAKNCSDKGIQIEESSYAEITDSTIDDNDNDGIGVLTNSGVIITGTVTTQNNTRNGLYLLLDSTALIYNSTFASTGNNDNGIFSVSTSSLLVVNSDIRLQTNVSNGLKAVSSSSVHIENDSTLTIEDSGYHGIAVYGTSRLYSGGTITIRRSQAIGLIASLSVNVSLRGSVKIEDCGSSGFVIELASSAYITDRLEVLNCAWEGISLRWGSSFLNNDNANIIIKNTKLDGVGISVGGNSILRAQGGSFLVESNAGDGFSVGRNSTLSLRDRGDGLNAIIQKNLGNGISVYEQGIVRIDESITIQNNTGWGITAFDGSSININNSIIQDNGGTGVQNNILLGFGARSTLNNNAIGGPLNCDSSVLSRGTTMCP